MPKNQALATHSSYASYALLVERDCAVWDLGAVTATKSSTLYSQHSGLQSDFRFAH